MSEPTFDIDSIKQIQETMEKEMIRLTGMVLVQVPVSLVGALEDAGVLHRTDRGMLRFGGKID